MRWWRGWGSVIQIDNLAWFDPAKLTNLTWENQTKWRWKMTWLMEDYLVDGRWPTTKFTEENLMDGRWPRWWKTIWMIEDNLDDGKQPDRLNLFLTEDNLTIARWPIWRKMTRMMGDDLNIYGTNVLWMTKIAKKWPENWSLQMVNMDEPFDPI